MAAASADGLVDQQKLRGITLFRTPDKSLFPYVFGLFSLNKRPKTVNKELLLTDKRLLLTNKRPMLDDKELLLTNKRLMLADKRLLSTNKRPMLADKEHLLTNKRLMLADKEHLLTNKSQCWTASPLVHVQIAKIQVPRRRGATYYKFVRTPFGVGTSKTN